MLRKDISYRPSAIGFGFTLIELLVVISIIAILAVLLIANLNATRSRARDTARKSDIRNIQTALRLYYNDFNAYPNSSMNEEIAGCGSNGDTICPWGTFFATDDDEYMSVLPADPLPDRQYRYVYVSDDEYQLIACLENRSDDRCFINPVDLEPLECVENVDGCQMIVYP